MTKWGGTGSPRSCVTWWILPVPLLKPTSSGLVTYTSEGTFSVKVNLFVYFFFFGQRGFYQAKEQMEGAGQMLNWQTTYGPISWYRYELAHLFAFAFPVSCFFSFIVPDITWAMSLYELLDPWSLIKWWWSGTPVWNLYCMQCPNIDYGGGLRSPNALLVSR